MTIEMPRKGSCPRRFTNTSGKPYAAGGFLCFSLNRSEGIMSWSAPLSFTLAAAVRWIVVGVERKSPSLGLTWPLLTLLDRALVCQFVFGWKKKANSNWTVFQMTCWTDRTVLWVDGQSIFVFLFRWLGGQRAWSSIDVYGNMFRRDSFRWCSTMQNWKSVYIG